MLDENKEIVMCRIDKGSGMFDIPKVLVKQDVSDEFELLFTYYPDEISFTADEFIGLTPKEAHALKDKRDAAYVRS